MIYKTQLSLTAAAIVGALALCAFTSTTSAWPPLSFSSGVDRVESIARMQQRLLNDRARLSPGDIAASSRWFEPAIETAE